MPKKQIIGVILGIVSALAWGSSPVFARYAYDGGLNPLTFLIFRSVVAALALGIYLRLIAGRQFVLKDPLNINPVIVCGLLMAGMSYGYLNGIKYAPVATVSFIYYLFPLIAGGLAHFFGYEKVGVYGIAAYILALFGLGVMLEGGAGSLLNASHDMRGLGFATLAAISFGVCIFWRNAKLSGENSIAITFYMQVVCSAAYIALTVLFDRFSLPQDGEGLLYMMLGVGLFAIAVPCFFLSIEILGTVRGGLVSYSEPIAASAAAYLILGELLSVNQYLGGGILLLAIVMSQLMPRAAGSKQRI